MLKICKPFRVLQPELFKTLDLANRLATRVGNTTIYTDHFDNFLRLC